MSYEKSLVAETPSAIASSQNIPLMREDREIDPYRAVKNKPTGQNSINSSEQESPEVPATVEETLKLSPQMAALARKEQQYRQKELEVKKKEEAMAAREAKLIRFEEMDKKLAAKDYSVIEKDVPYDDYTNYLINKESLASPEQQALKKIDERVTEIDKKIQDDVTKRFEAAVNERRKAVKSLIETNEEFSSIKELKAEEAVVKHILDTWEHDEIDLSPEEAAKEVEQLLLEKATKWSSLTKLKKQLDPMEATPDKKNLPPLKAPIKTITNNMAATGEIKRPQKAFSQMTSDQERYAEARRRAEEKLQLRTQR